MITLHAKTMIMLGFNTVTNNDCVTVVQEWFCPTETATSQAVQSESLHTHSSNFDVGAHFRKRLQIV